MKYMLVNVGPGGLQVDLHSPNPSYNKKNLHRPGPVVALSIPRGQSVDILPHFGGSVEKAHESVKFSRDALRLIKPNMLHTYVCDDDGKPIDMEKLFGIERAVTEEDKKSPPVLKPREDVTSPDMGQGAVLAAVDQHEAEAAGEANPPPAEEPPAEEPPAEEPPAEEPPVEEPPAEEPPAEEPPAEEPPVEEPVEETDTGLLDDEGKEATPDNLTEIKGVGEAVEQKLYESGFTTYASIAEADLDQLSEVVGSKAKDIQKQAKKLVK